MFTWYSTIHWFQTQIFLIFTNFCTANVLYFLCNISIMPDGSFTNLLAIRHGKSYQTISNSEFTLASTSETHSFFEGRKVIGKPWKNYLYLTNPEWYQKMWNLRLEKLERRFLELAKAYSVGTMWPTRSVQCKRLSQQGKSNQAKPSQSKQCAHSGKCELSWQHWSCQNHHEGYGLNSRSCAPLQMRKHKNNSSGHQGPQGMIH